MSMTQEEYDEIYRRALAACRPKPKPAVKPAAEKLAERCASKREEAVIDTATRANNALAETMQDRRRKQRDKELAEHSAQGPLWHALAYWAQSVERAQERIRALDGEIPEKGVYSPIARFEREMRGR
jgi:hypothetical protein